jgi:hypothetical protein
MAGDDRAEEIRLLKEIAHWARVAALPGLRARAQDLLDTDSKKRAYAAMDGATGVIAIEKTTGANHNDVAKWLKAWVPEGFLDRDATPPKASFSLTELGIDAPPPKAVRAKKSAA